MTPHETTFYADTSDALTMVLPEPLVIADPTGQESASIRVEWRDGIGLSSSTNVQVEEYGAAGFSGRGEGPLPIGSTVWVHEPGAVYGASVEECRDAGLDFEFRFEFLNLGRRREDLVRPGDEAIVSSGHGDQTCSTRALVAGMGSGGLQLLGAEEVALGARVRITGFEFECLGTVCYSVPTEEGYRTGVQFSKDPSCTDAAPVDSLT